MKIIYISEYKKRLIKEQTPKANKPMDLNTFIKHLKSAATETKEASNCWWHKKQ